MKSVEEVGRMPCMEKLDAFAQNISPKLRKELYGLVETFLVIGFSQGATTAALEAVGCAVNESDQDAFVAYLRRKGIYE